MTEAETILPRELTDIAGAVRNVPAPPTPELPEPYALRVADPDADAETLSAWMNQPFLAESWEYANPAPWWHRYLSAQLAGSYSRPLVASHHGHDMGYIELYWAAKDSIATRYDADPYDMGLHVAVADLALIKTGMVRSLLPHLVGSMLGLEPRCRRIMFDPDHRNKTARRFCEGAGCAFLGEHDMSNRRMALYALPRTPADVPTRREG